MTLMIGGAISGYCAIGRRKNATAAEDHEHDRDHGGEDRPVDEEMRNAHGLAAGRYFGCCGGRAAGAGAAAARPAPAA